MNPIQLVETCSSQGELNLIEKAIKRIESDNRPMAVVVIIGPARSGKSYLMNRLTGKNDGFPLGSTTCPVTKGFWLWVGDFPGDASRCLVLLDVEGLGDPKKFDQGTHDLKLFTQALLTSSLFIYNTTGKIEASALDGLHMGTKLATEMMNKRSPVEISELGKHFPHFVWVIRDQFLGLTDERGNTLTPKEFLEDNLKPEELDNRASKEMQDKVKEYNFSRNAIRNAFSSRDCFTFPMPVFDGEKMLNLDRVHDSELNPKFKKEADNFVQFVFNVVRNKQIEGSSLRGPAFAKMFRDFLESVNNKNVNIKSTYQMIAQEENQKAVKFAIKKFEEIFSRAKFPISAEKFANLLKMAREGGHSTFLDNCIAIEATPTYLEELAKTLKKMVASKEKENLEASAKECNRILKKKLESINEKMEFYLMDGGYEVLKKDIDELKLNYEMQNENLGPAKYEVWLEFQNEKVLKLFHIF